MLKCKVCGTTLQMHKESSRCRAQTWGCGRTHATFKTADADPKDSEGSILKATVPRSVENWGFRLQRGLVYEVGRPLNIFELRFL